MAIFHDTLRIITADPVRVFEMMVGLTLWLVEISRAVIWLVQGAIVSLKPNLSRGAFSNRIFKQDKKTWYIHLCLYKIFCPKIMKNKRYFQTRSDELSKILAINSDVRFFLFDDSLNYWMSHFGWTIDDESSSLFRFRRNNLFEFKNEREWRPNWRNPLRKNEN